MLKPPAKILRLPTVRARTGLSRSTIYKYVSLGLFPRPVHLSKRLIGFVEDEVQDWIAARVAVSRTRSL